MKNKNEIPILLDNEKKKPHNDLAKEIKKDLKDLADITDEMMEDLVEEDLPKKRKKFFWSFTKFDLNKFSERMRFLVTYIIAGILWIVLGDVFIHFTFKITGISMILIGGLGILIGCVVPILNYMEFDV